MTYSIVARDADTGELGVAVQSHWFSVASLCAWSEAGVGAVATQSFVETDYGPLGLELMRSGKRADKALQALLAGDEFAQHRQLGFVDSQGLAIAHTGSGCVLEAGQYVGTGFSCQANMMLKDTVPKAMAEAYQDTKGPLAGRMMAALQAAQVEGGDIRGQQAAGIQVVTGVRSKPWGGRLVDLRVEDNADPLAELQRLLEISEVYAHANRADDYMTSGDTENSIRAFSAAMKLAPENLEMRFWPAVTMAAMGQMEAALPLFKAVFAADDNWLEMLRRLPRAGLLEAEVCAAVLRELGES